MKPAPLVPDGRRGQPAAPVAAPAPEPAQPHVSFLGDDAANGHEHGERAGPPREDELIGTSGTHTPAPDLRGEEPSGELDAIDGTDQR